MTISEYHTHYLRRLFKITLILLYFHVSSSSYPSTSLQNMISDAVAIFYITAYGILKVTCYSGEDIKEYGAASGGQ